MKKIVSLIIAAALLVVCVGASSIWKKAEEVEIAVGESITLTAKIGYTNYTWYVSLRDSTSSGNIIGSRDAPRYVKAVSSIDTETVTITLTSHTDKGYFYIYCDMWNERDHVVEHISSDPIKIVEVTREIASEEDDAPVFDPTAVEIPTESPFADVAREDWFFENVMYSNALGLVNGRTPDAFEPYSDITYSEALKLAACIHQLYSTGEVTLVNSSPVWYDTYVDYAMENGIIHSGTLTNIPDIDNTVIDRKTVVDFFVRALPQTEYEPINEVAFDSVPDIDETSGAYADVYTFFRAGIITGDENGFRPADSITRAEVAAVVARMLNKALRVTF